MDLFNNLFDLNGDGELDSAESAFEFGAVEELLEEDEDEYGDDDGDGGDDGGDYDDGGDCDDGDDCGDDDLEDEDEDL